MDAQPPSSGKCPNIVFMFTDNTGYGEPGCYGAGILRGGSTPSRPALMTSCFSIRSCAHAVSSGAVRDGLTQREVSIAALLPPRTCDGAMWPSAGYKQGWDTKIVHDADTFKTFATHVAEREFEASLQKYPTVTTRHARSSAFRCTYSLVRAAIGAWPCERGN